MDSKIEIIKTEVKAKEEEMEARLKAAEEALTKAVEQTRTEQQ